MCIRQQIKVSIFRNWVNSGIEEVKIEVSMTSGGIFILTPLWIVNNLLD
jgi:hypothetical protein